MMAAVAIAILVSTSSTACEWKMPTSCEDVRAMEKCYGRFRLRIMARLKGATKEQIERAEQCLRSQS
jgi:hypothetical protein